MPTRPLPNDPSLEHLRKQAKRLRNAVRSADADALAQVKEFHPRVRDAVARFSLTDAQLVIARLYGFASWATLKQHLASIEPFVWNTPPPPDDASSLVDVFIRLACLVYGAWHRSNPAKARRLLDEHPELAHANIYTAAATGDVSAVRATIERDPALVHAKGGPLHWEPLLYACYSRLDDAGPDRSTLEVARLLLARGADPNAGFLWGATYPFTALTGAFGRGEDNMNELPHPRCLELATLLLDTGADSYDSQTLYNRHFEESDDHLKLLFSYGLGQQRRDARGPWRKRMGDRVHDPSTALAEQLGWAAMHNFPKRVKLLLDHGVDVNGRSPRDGRTPYESAARAGHDAIAKYLLQRGARKVDLDPIETFALACIAGRREEVRARLAEDPALLRKLGPVGQAELIHRAVDAKQLDGVRLIVELGVDVNAMVPHSGLDRSPLCNAAAWGTLEMVELLIELGADPNLRDETFHGAAIGWAAYGQQRHVVEYLLAFATIFDAVRCDGVERVAALLRQDPSLANATDSDGDPVVFYLHPELTRLEAMIELLTRHGASLDARNHEGKTLLDRALARGAADFANALRAHGARTSAAST